MADEFPGTEAVLTCGVRMVTAPDGAEIPVPSGGIGGITTPRGDGAWISDAAEVEISFLGGGYYVMVNSAAPANDEAQNLYDDFKAESLQALAERVLTQGAPFLFEGVLFVGGLLASIFTTSNLTREVFIRGEYNGVLITYCILL